jgi:tripartite-type tricarboxylate transporter receptor subunit TctC
VVQKFAELGSEPRGSSPAEFAQFLRAETAKWTEVMQKAKIKVAE